MNAKAPRVQGPRRLGQLQRGSEQVLTVDIDLGAWLQQAITVFVVDPDNEYDKRRVLTRWSEASISRFAAAKRLTYIGDHAGSANLLRDWIREEALVAFEPRKHSFRENEAGVFVGSEQVTRTSDGRQLLMFRGLERGLYHALEHAEVLGFQPTERRGFFGGADENAKKAVVRSMSHDGSLFEIEIT